MRPILTAASMTVLAISIQNQALAQGSPPGAGQMRAQGESGRLDDGKVSWSELVRLLERQASPPKATR